MAELTGMQRQLLARALGAPSMTGSVPRLSPNMAQPGAAMGQPMNGFQGLPGPVANAVGPYQGMQPPAGQRDFITNSPPPFGGQNWVTPGNPDPMSAIAPPQGPGIDRNELNMRQMLVPPTFRNI